MDTAASLVGGVRSRCGGGELRRGGQGWEEGLGALPTLPGRLGGFTYLCLCFPNGSGRSESLTLWVVGGSHRFWGSPILTLA